MRVMREPGLPQGIGFWAAMQGAAPSALQQMLTRVYACSAQGRKARRAPDPTVDEVRAGDQPQHCESARHRNPSDAARPRRRGDRIGGCYLLHLLTAACGTNRTY